jgi:hypothetical protein
VVACVKSYELRKRSKVPLTLTVKKLRLAAGRWLSQKDKKTTLKKKSINKKEQA